MTTLKEKNMQRVVCRKGQVIEAVSLVRMADNSTVKNFNIIVVLQAGQIANFDIKATETFSNAVLQVCIIGILFPDSKIKTTYTA